MKQSLFLRRIQMFWSGGKTAVFPHTSLSATPASNVPLIALRQLTKTFSEGGQTRMVLEQLDLTFTAGEFVVLLGHSGSGKSTLLNLMSGIETPSSGAVEIGGVDITALPDHQRTLFRRDQIGFVFQFFNLIPTLTVLENVTLPQELAGLDKTAVSTHAHHLLHRVGLGDRAAAFPDKLSGGEQQRVAIARAIAHDPMLLLADEPTGNLDEETGQRVLDLLLELTRTAGKTLIMATHNPDIAKLADRVLRVQDGGITEERRLGEWKNQKLSNHSPIPSSFAGDWRLEIDEGS